jgi:hypothetical protein
LGLLHRPLARHRPRHAPPPPRRRQHPSRLHPHLRAMGRRLPHLPPNQAVHTVAHTGDAF